MIIRKINWSCDNDLTQISKLLNLAFNKIEDVAFSNEFLIWKHKDNPFGESVAYGAFDNDKLVCFRAFMRWEFIKSKKVIKAFQPVDTATHPDFRGKGLFSKLTKSLMMEVGDTIIFNRPNEMSFSGYIKLGWLELDKIRFCILPRLLSFNKINEVKKINSPTKSNLLFLDDDKLKTNISDSFINWRYKEIPYFSYEFIEIDNVAIIYRVNIRNISKFKLKELLILNVNFNNSINNKKLKYIFQYLLSVNSCHYAIFIENQGVTNKMIKVPFKYMNLVSNRKMDYNFSLSDVEVF